MIVERVAAAQAPPPTKWCTRHAGCAATRRSAAAERPRFRRRLRRGSWHQPGPRTN